MWSDKRRDDSFPMPITFQPENIEYCVVSVTIGVGLMVIVMYHNNHNINNTDGHLIYIATRIVAHVMI